jgi:ribonuclease P protein subunit RPR2
MAKARRHKEEKKQAKDAAKMSITNLFEQARDTFSTKPALSDRYVDMARKIAMKSGTRIPSLYKRQFCKKCYCYLMPGKNCRVRTTTKTITYYCQNCKSFSRIPYKKDKSKIDSRKTQPALKQK